LHEGYNYSKAKEDQILTDARRNTGAMGVANSLLGGGVVGGGLSSAGVTTRRLLSSAPLSLGCTATSAADAAALGDVDAVQSWPGPKRASIVRYKAASKEALRKISDFDRRGILVPR